jgi:GxxExxY protein
MIKYEGNYLYSEMTEKIIGEVYKVYNTLGFGFLEKVYKNALCKRLNDIGLKAVQQFPITVNFEETVVGEYCADIFVEDKIIVELKAVETIIPIFEVQLVNYLKATGIEVGLLINFGPKLGIKRKVFSANHNLHTKSASKKL